MTPSFTHRACPVDGSPCWSRRECGHVGEDGVRACMTVKNAEAVTFDTPDPWRVGEDKA